MCAYMRVCGPQTHLPDTYEDNAGLGPWVRMLGFRRRLRTGAAGRGVLRCHFGLMR